MRHIIAAALLLTLPAVAFADDAQSITLSPQEYQELLLTLIEQNPPIRLLYEKQITAQAEAAQQQSHAVDKSAQPAGK